MTQAADWRSGPRWGVKSALCPVHPFPLRGTSPQGETRSMERKNRRVIYFMYHSGVFPFGGERSEPITRMRIMPYDTDSQSRNAPCVPFRGRGPRSGEGVDGGNPDYDTRCGRDRRRRHYNIHRPLKGKRLTTFCASLALLQNVFAVHRRAIPQPSGPKAPSNLRTLRPIGPVNPKNLPFEPSEPSHRRCVQGPFPLTIPPSLYTLVNKTISEKRKPCFPISSTRRNYV